MGEYVPDYLPWQEPLLRRAIALNAVQRLPHALLIDSAGTTDMTPFILYLSMLLLCERAEDIEVCRDCKPCRMLLAGAHADFSLVGLSEDEKTKKISKNIKIEQIRNLIHEVTLTRHFDALKIAAIYPAEAMNQASANALLKTLEEPPAGVLLVLATHNRGRVPVTIRSRCQSWSINRPDAAQARDWLQQQGMAADEAGTYLEYAGGDPLLALELKQQEYGALVDNFKRRFAGFLRGESGVSGMCRELLQFDGDDLRRLMQMTLDAYCYQMSGVNALGEAVEGADPARARQLFELRLRAQNQLRTDENNLDLQLQLEDVLISLKQILTRRQV